MPPDDPAPQPSDNPTPSNYQRTTGGNLRWKPPSVERLAELLAGYEVISMLGAGGMGAVYKARQKSLDRLVAIKVLPPEAAGDEDARFVERFKNEARTMARMNHPGIVNVYDFGETSEGQLYFVMEFIDGTDVAKMIASQGRLPPEHALAITAHVCDALAYAHKHGVVHRDIKPANVLINMEGAVKVADFGLARMDDPSRTSGLTRTGMAMGTPDFVAPEALIMGVSVDGRADLYAVGVMLYNMLTGEVPRGFFQMPSQKAGSDPRFDGIVRRAMEQDRDQRYQSAVEIRRDLDVILTMPMVQSGGPATAAIPKQQVAQKPVARGPQKPLGKSAKVPVRDGAEAASAPPDAAEQNAAAPRKTNPGPIIGIAATVVIAAGLYFLFKPKPPPAAQMASEAATAFASSSTPKPTPSSPRAPGAATPKPPPSQALPPSPGPLPVGVAKQTIDLLALTDPVKDRIPVPSMMGKNEWKREGAALVFQSDGKSGKLAAPVVFNCRDYEIEFAADRLSGSDPIHVDIPLASDRIVPLVLNSPGRKILNEKAGAAWGPSVETVHLVIRVVDASGAGDRITIRHHESKGDPLVDWSGDLRTLGKPGERHPAFPMQRVASVFVKKEPYAIKTWTLRVLDGAAGVLRPAAAPPATIAQPAALVPPTGFLTHRGHLYLLMTEPTDLKGAAKTASDLGGHLATITSQAEHDFLVSAIGQRLAPRTQIWLGGLIKPEESSFTRWETGEPASFLNWADGMSPDKRPVRDLRIFATAPDLRWGHTHSKFYAFLVEWDDDAIPPAKSADPASLIGWSKVLPDLAAEVAKKGGTAPSVDGSVAIPLGAYPLMSASVADVAVRGRYQGKFDLMLRGDGKTGIRLRFSEGGATISRIALDGKILSEDRSPVAVIPEHRFIAAVAGKALRVWMDGALVADLALPSWRPGQVHVASYGPPVTIHELELALIPGNFTTLPLPPTPNLAGNKPGEPVPPQVPAAMLAPPDDPRVAQLEAGFQAALKRDALDAFDKAIAALDQSYLGALGRARATAQAQGSLELVTALDGEKARITSGLGVPPEDVGGTPETLVQLRQTYRATAAKLAVDRDKAAAPLYDKYVAALDLYVAELTRANAIEKAGMIKSFRDALAAKKPAVTDAAAPAAPPAPKAGTAPKSSAAAPPADIRGSSWTAAAKWVLSVGGTLQVVRNGRQFPIESEKDIPGGRFDIVQVDIKTNPKSAGITDDDFSRLAPLKELKTMRLDGIQAGDAAFAFARTTTGLTSFSTTRNDKVTDAVFEHLAALENITVLQFQRCPRITGVGLSKLASLPKLVDVWLDVSGTTDAGLKELGAASAMSGLVLNNTAITDQGLEAVLPRLANLRLLNLIACTGVTGSSFVHLKGLNSLTDFHWGHAKGSKTMHPEALASIGACPSLRRLSFDFVPITDADLRNLSPLRNLIQLTLTRSQVTGTGFAALGEMKLLVILYLGYETPITGEGLKAIAAALPQIEQLHLGVGAKLSPEDFRTFGAFKSVNTLTLNRCQSVTDGALAAMELPPALERLDMQGAPITAAGLARWKAPPKLARLNLHYCDALDDTAIPHLKKLTALSELVIQLTGITEAGAAELRKSLPNCSVAR